MLPTTYRPFVEPFMSVAGLFDVSDGIATLMNGHEWLYELNDPENEPRGSRTPNRAP